MYGGEADPAAARDAESIRMSCPSIYGTPARDGSRHQRNLAGQQGLVAFGATAAGGHDAAAFQCRLLAARFGPIGLSSARFTPHTRSTSGDHFQHSHPVSRLLFVREGSVLLDLAGTRTTMIAGSGAIIPGDQPSSYTATRNSLCLQVDVDANDTRLAPLLRSAGPALWPSGTTTLQAAASFIVTLLDADANHLQWSDRALSRRTVEALVCALVASAPPPLTAETPEPSIAQTAMLYIRTHHRDPDLTSDTIARALGVSTRTLQRAFAGTTSVSRRITDSRVDTLLAMVRNPQYRDVPVAALCARAGFGSTETMRRCVRAATGMSLRAYRDAYAADARTADARTADA